MSFQEQVKHLQQSAIDDISYHYDAAVESEHGSGDHWILMSVLDKYGSRTHSPIKAVEVAEEIIMLWYRYQK